MLVNKPASPAAGGWAAGISQPGLSAFVSCLTLKIGANASISGTPLLEPGEICMIICFSQIARPRPIPMRDAVAGL